MSATLVAPSNRDRPVRGRRTDPFRRSSSVNEPRPDMDARRALRNPFFRRIPMAMMRHAGRPE
jgi:hypothetical protein